MKAAALVVLRALGLGDFLTGVPAYRALARAFPDHRRVLAAPRALHAFVPLLGDAFAGALDVGPLAALPECANEPSIAVNLHGRGPQSHRILLAARPGRLIAFAHPEIAACTASARWRADEHEVSRWCRLLRHEGIAADETALAIDVPDVDVPVPVRGATIVHAGAASAARQWPLERFAAVVRKCERDGERVILTGSIAERGLANELAQRAGLPPERNLAGRTSLPELAALVAHAARVVCGDTGVAHLASAFGIPSVVLFGPVSPREWGPPQHAIHRVLWAGARGDPHGASVDAGLLAITPADVFAQFERLDALAAAKSRE